VNKFQRALTLLLNDPGEFLIKLGQFVKRKQRNSKEYSADANKIHLELLKDVKSIDQGSIEAFWEVMVKYCRIRRYEPSYVQNWKSHVYRLFISMEWIRSAISLLGNDSKLNAIETGGETVVTDLLRENFPNVQWLNTIGDLRIDWGLPENSADLIVCMEVVEHLSDLPEGFQDSFRMTGVKSMLDLAFRTLHRGGIVFITTPNAGSWLSIYNILMGSSPMFFEMHIHEYTLEKLIELVKEKGFSLLKVETVFCYTVTSGLDYRLINQFLTEYGFDVNNRGDGIFLLARKP
jgi:hypothetical protein